MNRSQQISTATEDHQRDREEQEHPQQHLLLVYSRGATLDHEFREFIGLCVALCCIPSAALSFVVLFIYLFFTLVALHFLTRQNTREPFQVGRNSKRHVLQ